MKFVLAAGAFALAATLAAGSAFATTITDTTGFLPQAFYSGPHNGDMDIKSVSATIDGSDFILSATLDGPIGTTANAVYVWGVNTGDGTAAFAPEGLTKVLFNDVVVINPAAPAAGVTISGDTVTDIVSIASLKNEGFSPSQYGFSFWPNLGAAGNSDFAPDNATFTASAVPEPASWAIMLVGFGGLGAVTRHARRKRMTPGLT
ncbi:MAG TPA: PEPxxWA-CTERM sorting domain-containing protein [Caulobacteraceae bacterium]|jgi:hypothetical protein|nr:PEPxxWA-CTERM sorting domain-containing protein [Caulobacteraceae bacterium]